MIYHRAYKVVHHYLLGSIYIVFYQFPSNSCNYFTNPICSMVLEYLPIRLHKSASFVGKIHTIHGAFKGLFMFSSPARPKKNRHGDARGTDLARRSRAASVRGDLGVEAPETAPEAVPPVSPASSSPRMARFSSWQKRKWKIVLQENSGKRWKTTMENWKIVENFGIHGHLVRWYSIIMMVYLLRMVSPYVKLPEAINGHGQ